jgi:hypothetical protein
MYDAKFLNIIKSNFLYHLASLTRTFQLLLPVIPGELPDE